MCTLLPQSLNLWENRCVFLYVEQLELNMLQEVVQLPQNFWRQREIRIYRWDLTGCSWTLLPLCLQTYTLLPALSCCSKPWDSRDMDRAHRSRYSSVLGYFLNILCFYLPHFLRTFHSPSAASNTESIILRLLFHWEHHLFYLPPSQKWNMNEIWMSKGWISCYKPS